MSSLNSIKAFLFGYGDCAVPTPDSPEKKQEEEPIIFDESENPAQLELQKKFPLRPPSFEMLLQPLRIATMIEPVEGVKIEFGAGLSQRLQLMNSWTLPHGQGGSYDITFMYAGGKTGNAYDFASPSPFLMARFSPSQGRQDIKTIYKVNENIESRLSANYMSFEPRESQVMLEADYLGNDFVAGMKVSAGLEMLFLNYMQSLTKNLVFGFEIMNMRKPRQIVDMSYGGKYILGDTTMFAQYMAAQKLIHLGATIKGNPNITYSTELVYNGQSRDLQFVGGVCVRFMRARFLAQITGTGTVSSYLQHYINPFFKMGLHAETDFFKQEQKFGISINLGAT